MGNGCNHVELGTPVQFEMEVTLKTCTSETFTVHPVGIQEEMIIEIEPICNCPCSVDIPEKDACGSPDCNFAGHSICGVCHCCGTAFGTKCQCPYGTLEDQQDPEFKCRPTFKNGTITREGPVCSDRGRCECGECLCNDPRPGVSITGKFCQTVRIISISQSGNSATIGCKALDISL